MKRIMTVLFLGVLLITGFFSLGTQVSAAEDAKNWRNADLKTALENADNGQLNSEANADREYNVVRMLGTGCRILYFEGLCPKQERDDKRDIKQTPYKRQDSVVGFVSSLIDATYTTPPASTYAFIIDTGQSLGFIPRQIYAQENGTGFTGFQTILPLWKMFRNIAYFFLAIVMIVIGFMIMFRKKIDAHTVVSIQNALPRIILTLILITFSYAIVGIVIDLMYVLILFIVTMFESTKLLPTEGPTIIAKWFGYTSWSKIYAQGGLPAVFGQIEVSPVQIILGVPATALTETLTQIPGTGALVGLIGSAANSMSTDENLLKAIGRGTIASILGLAMPLVWFLFSLAMLYLFIRLLVVFASAYIQIIMALLFGPIQILMGAFPGSDAFTSWMKNLIANVAVFPIATTMFMLSNVFAGFANKTWLGEHMWIPPYTSFISNTTSVAALISLGILFTIPNICASLKELIKAKSAVDAGPGVILSPFAKSAGTAWNLAYQYSIIKHGMGSFVGSLGGKQPGQEDKTHGGR